MKKPIKVILWGLGIFLILVIALLIAVPEFIKNYIEENDLELIGREIFIDDIDINYFTGLIRLKKFDLKEPDGEETFISFDLLETNIQPWHLLRNSVYVESHIIDGLHCNIVQNGSSFNFDDLIAKSDGANSDPEEGEAWSFTIRDFNMKRSSIRYQSNLQSEIKLDSIRLNIPLASDTVDIIDAMLSLDLSSGGHLSFQNRINMSQSLYSITMLGDSLNLELLKGYVDPYMNINRFAGKLNSKLHIEGSWENTDILNLGGFVSVHDFLITDQRDDKFLAFDTMAVDIDSIIMNEAVYRIAKLESLGLYGVFELYDDGDNYTNILAETADSLDTDTDTTQVQTGLYELTEEDYANPFKLLIHYVGTIAKSYQNSAYSIDEVDVRNSVYDFHDYTTSDPFRYRLSDLKLHADSINSNKDFLTITLGSVMNNTGTFDGTVKLSTQNLRNLDLHYEIEGTDLTAFSPYTADFIDYPISIGELVYVNDTKIRDGIIVSQNVMDANQFTWGERINGNALYNLPVKLAVSLLRDLDGNIHLDIPIEGELNDPKYKLGKVIWSTVKNIILKVVSAPFRFIAGMFKLDEDKLKKINFGLIQFKLDKEHQKQLDDLNKVLSQKEDLNIEFKRLTRKYEEVERYAMIESKYRYLFGDENIPEPNEIDGEKMERINGLDIKDSLFVEHVSGQLHQIDEDLPIQKKCIEWVGMERAIQKTDWIGQSRTEAIENYLVGEKGLEPSRLRFKVLPDDSLITHRSNTIFNVGFWAEE